MFAVNCRLISGDSGNSLTSPFSLGTPCCAKALGSFRINVNTTPEKFKKINACDKKVGAIESKYVNAAVTMKTEFKVIMRFYSI